MNHELQASVELVRGLLANLDRKQSLPEIIIAPPATALSVVHELIKDSPIRLAAQNCHWEASGAFTGELSASQIKDVGSAAVILGHSERRQYFGETDETVAKRLKSALAAGLVPIVCVGETLDERESQRTWKVLETQLKGALSGFAPADLAPLVVAYEPVWAIGTGKTATPAQAQEAHAFIRKTVAGLYNQALADGLRILYGGSVKPGNIDQIMAEADVDGALVGGASLKVDSFSRIIAFRESAAR